MRVWIATALGYVAASTLFLWPLPAHLATHVWGDRFDAWTTLWLIDHLHQGVVNGTLRAETTDILFPVGYNLWSFGHAALQILGVGLMGLGIPLVPAYNLLLIGALASSALAAHALGHALSRSHLGGLVAGATFATSPYLYGEGAAGCIELVAAGLIPLFVLTLIHVVRDPGWRTAARAALTLAIVGPFNWYYTLFAGMLGVAFCAWQFVEGRGRAVGWMVGAMVVAAALDAPLIPLVRRETPTRPPLSVELFTTADAWERSTAVTDGTLALASLSEQRLEEHDAVEVYRNSTAVSSLAVARFSLNPLDSTPGALAFTVGLVGLALGRRRGWGWGVIAGGATVLTLGPFLTPDGSAPIPDWSARLPMPYWFAYQYVPFFAKAYRPYRIGVDALVACSALGAVGMGTLLALGRERLTRGAAVGVSVIGFTQPFWSGDRPGLRPLADATIPPVYTALGKLPRGAVIELPLQYQPITNANARFQYHQVAHRLPLLNCNQLIRRTDLLAFRDYVLANDFIEVLLDLGRKQPPFRYTPEALGRAVRDGFRYVVLHTRVDADEGYLAGAVGDSDRVGMVAMNLLRDSFGEPVLSGDGVEVYQLPEAVEPGPERVWTGADVQALDLPVDSGRLGIPLVLRPAGAADLYVGPARKLGFWARPEGEVAVDLQVRDAAGLRAVPLDVTPGTWTWNEVKLEGEARVRLVARGEAPSVLHLSRGEVQR